MKLLAVLAAGILIPSIHAELHLEVHHGAPESTATT